MPGGAKEQKPQIVARFKNNNDEHQIVRTPSGKYCILYFVKDGKARATKSGVQFLPTAIEAIKKRYPNVEEIKD